MFLKVLKRMGSDAIKFFTRGFWVPVLLLTAYMLGIFIVWCLFGVMLSVHTPITTEGGRGIAAIGILLSLLFTAWYCCTLNTLEEEEEWEQLNNPKPNKKDQP